MTGMRRSGKGGKLATMLDGSSATCRVLALIISVLLISAAQSEANVASLGAGAPVKRHTIFHAFNWRLGTVVHRLNHLQEMGYDALQISPLQKSIGDEWWARYQPVSHECIEGLGSKEELTELCIRAREKGIMVIADLVFNHMAVSSPSGQSYIYGSHSAPDVGSKTFLVS